MKQGVIYSLASSASPSQVRYIGATLNPDTREKYHLRNGDKRHGTPVTQWIGSELAAGHTIIFTVLASFPDAVLWEKEKDYIALHRQNGSDLMNVAVGGRGGCLHNSDTAAKISERLKEGFRNGRETSELAREKARENMTAYNKSDAHRVVASVLGKVHGPANLKKAQAKHRLSEDLREKIKLLKATTPMLGKEIAAAVGVSLITVRRVLNGKRYAK